MDTIEDVPGTPARRPESVLSAGASSTAASSIHLRNQFFTIASPVSQATQSSGSNGVNGKFDGGRSISPFETLECERLIFDLRFFLPDSVESDETTGARRLSRSDSLEDALSRAASTIRYNAKWFSALGISSLLHIALEAASGSSSSSSVLKAALGLIDTINTFSLIPPHQGLASCVRFITATYYSASRANKTKGLAAEAWTTLLHILESHLGSQCVVALLSVIGDGSPYLRTRSGYAHVTGALILISDHQLYKNTTPQIPDLSVSNLLLQVKAAALEGDEHIREHIMRLITHILADASVVSRVTDDAGFEQVLEIAYICVCSASDAPVSKSLVENILRWSTKCEPRHQVTLAFLCIDVGIPLTAPLRVGLVLLWLRQVAEHEWPDHFQSSMKRLSVSATHLDESTTLVRRSLDAFLTSSNEPQSQAMLRVYKEVLVNPDTDPQVAHVMGKELVAAFEACMSDEPAPWQRRTLFDALCEVADCSVEAAMFLFRIRADVAGTLYVRARSDIPITSARRSLGVLATSERLPIEAWHRVLLKVISEGARNWATYDCYLFRFFSLLSNHKTFEDADFISNLLQALCEQFTKRSMEPPASTGLSKTYVVAKHIQMLTVMISYHPSLSKAELTNLISIFNGTAGSGDHTVSIQCIHALTICCYEIPDLIAKYMEDIIDKMSKLVTQRFLAIHVLQFIAGLSRLPDLHRNFTQDDYKKIFGVCHSYLQSTRGATTATSRKQTPTSDRSSGNRKEEALPEYVYALAHHTITFWYLSLARQSREALKPFITSCLTYKGPDGNDTVEDQGMVTIDMMDRVDAEALNESHLTDEDAFSQTDGRLVTRHRLVGLLLISTETALRTGRTLATIRRPSGTAQRMLSAGRAVVTVEADETDYIPVVEDDLQGRTYGSINVPRNGSMLGGPNILTLEDDDAVNRAMQSFDRTSALDSHKAGVIYIGERQTTEDRILQNVSGSPDYREFLLGLGKVQALKGATFNTQGLDRAEDADGEHTIVWNNDVTELVFHITTMMPNNDDTGLNTANKKRHIGNDHVNIVFNNSGASLDFTTLYNMFPGQLTFVYIVITPSARTSFVEARTQNVSTDKKDRFYKVRVVARPDYPNLAPAAEEKVVSGASLPGFVRSLALNDCIISLMWSPRNEGSEYPSSWRERMGQLKRMGMRYGKA